MIKISNDLIGLNCPTYFIADIAANHDGDLGRAKNLIFLAKQAGANAVKFQHFQAETIVSDYGFKNLGHVKSHQSSWGASVFEVYKQASVKLDWTSELVKTCDEVGITFFTTPYSLELVDYLDAYVPAYKIGSGDITWLELIKRVAQKNKPYLIATGASSFDEVVTAVDVGLQYNDKLILMQCNTNYTASLQNFRYIQLNVLKAYANMYPNLILGLSDHTPGHATVLGSVALGARVIEKHFTDDHHRVGPDHKFSMTPVEWKDMVDRTRELELSLGNGIKRVEENERETVILQRRSVRVTRDISEGHILKSDDLICLRPSPNDAFQPNQLNTVIGKKLRKDIKKGDYLSWDYLF